MKLRRSFASFALVLLLFLGSWLPFCIDIASAESVADGYELALAFGHPYSDPNFDSSNNPVYVPSAVTINLDKTPGDTVGVASPWWLKCNSNLFEPVDYERTVYVAVGYVGYGDSTFTGGNASYMPDITYSREGHNSFYTYTDGVRLGGYIYSNITDHGEVASLRITIPAYANSISFDTEDYLWWVLGSGFSYDINSYGAYIVDSADDAVLDVVEQILAKVTSIEADTGNILAALNSVLDQLRMLNADTDTIVSLLQSLELLSTNQLAQLEKISSSVDAIYYFLTEEMKNQAEDMSQAAQDTSGQIDNTHTAEAYWQTSMQGNYDSLDLENFSFGGVVGGIELVGRIFSDMFSAFGQYQIIFTFPLTLGIALLVIGKISKSSGRKGAGKKGSKEGD